MGRKIVHDDDVPRLQDRHEELFDIGHKNLTVDGAVIDHRGDHAVDPQTADQGCGFPVPMGNTDMQSLALGTATTWSCHCG